MFYQHVIGQSDNQGCMYNWTGLHGTLDRTRGMISMKLSIDSRRIKDVVDAPLDVVVSMVMVRVRKL